MTARLFIIASLAAGLTGSACATTETSLLQTYQSMTCEEAETLYNKTVAGDIDANVHYSFYLFANKKLADGLYWMKVLEVRAQLESIANPEYLENVESIVTMSMQMLLLELQEQDSSFKQEAEELFKTLNLEQLSEQALLFVQEQEAERQVDEYTDQRAELLEQLAGK